MAADLCTRCRHPRSQHSITSPVCWGALCGCRRYEEPAVTVAEARCERSDLPTSMCAHCRGTAGEGPAAAPELGPLFEARFDGRCADCGESFDAGETIAALADGTGYACSECLL